MRDLVRPLVANNAAGHALDVRQEIIQRLHFALGRACREKRARAFYEVVEIFLRMAKGVCVSLHALATDVEVGIEAALQRENFDLEIFADQQCQRTLGSRRARCIRIEVNNNVLAEAAQQLGLNLGECRAGAGDHVVESGVVDRDAIHLALDQDGVVEFADRLFGFIEIEQHARLGVDRTSPASSDTSGRPSRHSPACVR